MVSALLMNASYANNLKKNANLFQIFSFLQKDA